MSSQTYQAETMYQALQQIQKELGPDAVVLSARELPSGRLWEKQKRTSVEVVAIPAHEFAGLPASLKSPQPVVSLVDDESKIEWVVADPKRSTGSILSNGGGVLDGCKEGDQASANLVSAETLTTQPLTCRSTNPPGKSTGSLMPERELPKGLRVNREILTAQGLEEKFLDRILRVVSTSIAPAKLQDEDVSRKYLNQALQAELRDLNGLALHPPARIVSLVGPSGVGKTSLAAKLALFYRQQGKKIVWISADTVRTGAITEARLYTETLTLRLELVYTPDQLKPMIESMGDADLILIDTPGYNPMDEGQMSELASFLAEVPGHFKLLVMPATIKELDALRTVSALNLLGLNGLAVTKLDETASIGSVYNIARQTRIPLVYFSDGKTVVGHLQLATAESLVDAMFRNGDFR